MPQKKLAIKGKRRIRSCGGSGNLGCGRKFLARKYPCGTWQMYCTPCATAHSEKLNMIRDIPAVCDECGKKHMIRRIKHANIKSRVRLGKQDRYAVYCSRECATKRHRKWPVNPRGLDYCRAPVEGGCPFLRQKISGKRTLVAFCQAHKKRYQRGGRLDTHINLKLSAAMREARGNTEIVRDLDGAEPRG